jgi:quercetin dioxygenase-like cupin family protein
MAIQPVNLFAEAVKLTKPFHLLPLARVDDFVAMVFVCHGAVAWHKHEDHDELFFVQRGRITLETWVGSVELDAGQIAVAPRQVPHRSHSDHHALVLLFERTTETSSRNGRRKVFATGGEESLTKVDLVKLAEELEEPFAPQPVAQVNDFGVYLCLADGAGPWQQHPGHDVLVLGHQGVTVVDTDGGEAGLRKGELLMVPRGLRHRLTANEPACCLLFASRELSLGV